MRPVYYALYDGKLSVSCCMCNCLIPSNSNTTSDSVTCHHLYITGKPTVHWALQSTGGNKSTDMSLIVTWHQQWNANRSPQALWTGLQWHSLVMGSLFGAEWRSLRTWPKMRKSNDLWPLSEPCCGRFHSSGHTNKCTARSHRSSWGCFLEDLLRASEAQCLRCAEDLPGGKRALSRALAFRKCRFFLCGFWGASWPWLQDHNRWPTGHPRRGLLVPSSCHICFTPRLWLPGDCFLTVPHSRHHGYTIPIVGKRPQRAQTHTYTHALKPLEALNHHMQGIPKPLSGIILSV